MGSFLSAQGPVMSGVQFRQDMPPPQGFPKIQYRRDLPKRGLSGWGTFAVGGAILVGGLYIMGLQNRHTRAVKQETRRRRLNVAALLQAEEDRRYLRELLARYEVEEGLTAGRTDFEAGGSVYNDVNLYVVPIHVERVNGWINFFFWVMGLVW